MYHRDMEKRLPPSVLHLSLTTAEQLNDNSRHCGARPSELTSFPSRDESAACASPRVGDASKTATTHHLTLLQRREKKLCSASFPSLDAETLLDKSRAAVTWDVASAGLMPRGWFLTHTGKKLSPLPSNGRIKLVSYNILAQRLVSTELYPHCPMFALAEDYRCSLLKQELARAAPDIIALQEISVDVFEKPGLLGDWLRSKYRFAGDHVVVTDARGRPRYERYDISENTSDSRIFDETNLSASQREGKSTSRTTVAPSTGDSRPQRRPEMEGVCVLYLQERFDPCEVVPIRFNEIAAADTQLTQRERRSLQAKSHNVALISVLRDRVMPNMIYVIGTVHLIWNRTECQLWQMHHVLRKMEELKENYEKAVRGEKGEPPRVSLVLAGDFNSDAMSPPIRYALTGVPPPGSEVMKYWKLPDEGEEVENDPEFGEMDGPSPLLSSSACATVEGQQQGGRRKRYRITDTVGHSLAFSDSYATYRKQHPWHVSTVNPSSNGEGGVLDHILVDERHVVCTSVMKLSGYTELPTKDCPSDHYPVGVTILPRTSLE
ncbi:putative trans-sialidase [Trypanosoma rangeli]|uniref:Putative trans-sialidase n=1 Tax=Trypanosoma rangeli TaxID=5698 RepID=A0A422N3T1_TRYRA|nr:putative trans-sialidase [Trypanosoma rangeli]RNF00139.1 putative trans-sialidase [Trypanosoma rangeli]|eukprot:RNF00139.1 putative trans-sialidase [Trypanosoma rangeli]